MTVRVLDPYGNLETSDITSQVTVRIASGPGSFSGSSTTTVTVMGGVASFSNLILNIPGTYTLEELVVGALTGPSSGSFNLVPLQVSTFLPTSTGFITTFNRPLNPSGLNLYDAVSAGYGAADITVVGSSTGTVKGSLLLDPTSQTITFIKTGGLLAADTYTVTLRSAANGFQDTTGGLLDGNADLTPGDSYLHTFVVSSSSAVAVSVPDFARGPGQAVDVPATASGIPIKLSNGVGVTTVTLTLQYDPSLLTITGGSTSLAGATFTVNTTTPGAALVTFSTPALGAGPVTIGQLTATVPTTAPYRSKELLHLDNIQINAGAIPASNDDAVHVAAYLGDTSGNGTVDALDAALASRVAAASDSGFASYRLADPVLIADTNGSGTVNGPDAGLIARVSVNLPTPQIPVVPNGVTILGGGLDPTLSIPVGLLASPGDTVTVPVNIDNAVPADSTGLTEATLALRYDPSVLTLTSADIRLGDVPLSGTSWSLTSTTDATTGQLAITLFSTTPLTHPTGGSLVTIDFHVQSGAAEGATAINLVAAINVGGRMVRTEVDDTQGAYVLSPAPTNGTADVGVDGVITVHGAAPMLAASVLSSAVGSSTDSIFQPAILDPYYVDLVQRATDLVGQEILQRLEGPAYFQK